ncbi:hypothetical protein ICW40_07425 [Actinotalea ferrariae]|uniref:DUF6225 family protein n=1 Tax=Actinotalea ferrariae TaxID=1386098 RepID=UPI001C8BD4A5|nr:DUF6225 family protein [Actinotalea ferrariae]MBX9244639.1 hypothetical protein [Actinotalea ferrariae]
MSSSTQWTVGQLRAELVGLPDDTPLVIDIYLDPTGIARRRVPVVGAGYGPDIDPTDPLFEGQEYPLTAGYGDARAEPGTGQAP